MIVRSLHELVKDGKNGLVFSSSEQLARQLSSLFAKFPTDTSELDRLRRGVQEFLSVRWADSWRQHALPLFRA